MKKNLTLVILSSILLSASAQNLTVPEASQKAMIMQRIGLTDITITYHSPIASNRSIWGTLVPYNEVWRAGANENTVINFTSDVTINGKNLEAGSYGLHMIPTEKDWTIIFSKNYTSWGSFFYKKDEDALRITVTPKESSYQDWLSYTFTDLKPNSTTVLLTWEKLLIPFTVMVDVNNVVLENMRTELRGLPGFSWQGYQQAAAFCLRNNISIEEGRKWVERSIGIQKTFANLRTKAQYLRKENNNAEADKLMTEAMALADEAQINTYGYDLIAMGKNNEALEIFKTNVKRYPQSWNVYDSLGEIQLTLGNKKDALANYKTALAKAPAEQHSRINGIIKTIVSK